MKYRETTVFVLLGLLVALATLLLFYAVEAW